MNKWVKKRIVSPLLKPVDRFVVPLLSKSIVALLRLFNKWKFKNPRQQIDNRTVLLYCPNIGGHRPIYSAKFIDYYRRNGYEVYYAYCGIEVDFKRRIYEDFESRFLESFKEDEGVHMVCLRDQIGRDTDELALIVELQEKFMPTLTIFVDGDVLLNTFKQQALPGKPRLLGKNYAVFIMIDFIYRDMSLTCLLREPKKRPQVAHLLFHKYYFKYLDLLDGALVSDENLVRECRPSKHIPMGDVIHYPLPPDDHVQKNKFFSKVIAEYDEFLLRNPGKDVILQFGELEERKGYDFLLRLVAENPDMVLVRAGRTKPSYRIKWESLLRREQLLLEGRLFEVDIFIDSQDLIDKLFGSIKYFLFAYKNHFRTSIMMALALSYDNPVMVPGLGLMKWRMNQHKCGVIYDHNSYESFAKEFTTFRVNYQNYLENTRKYYQECFSDEAFDRCLGQLTNSHAAKQLDTPTSTKVIEVEVDGTE